MIIRPTNTTALDILSDKMAPFGKIWSYIPSPRVMRVRAAYSLVPDNC